MAEVYVLTKQTDDHLPTVMAVYTNETAALARVGRIAKANAQYPMRELSPNRMWVVGPEEDEGFFGHKPVTVRITPAPLKES